MCNASDGLRNSASDRQGIRVALLWLSNHGQARAVRIVPLDPLAALAGDSATHATQQCSCPLCIINRNFTARRTYKPIHYNPNINGRFGAALIDTPKTILALRDSNRSQARLIRTSAERTRVCQEYYNTSVKMKMAKMKCTHFIHLLKGLQNKNIGRVSILTFEQFTKRAVHYGLRDAPLSKNQYERLLKGITSQKPW